MTIDSGEPLLEEAPLHGYALLGVRFLLNYFVPVANMQLVDASGHSWMLHDIHETAALAAVFTILAFSVVAALRLADSALRPRPR